MQHRCGWQAVTVLVLGLSAAGCEDAKYSRDSEKAATALAAPAKDVRAARQKLEQKIAEPSQGSGADRKLLETYMLAAEVGRTAEEAHKVAAGLSFESKEFPETLRHIDDDLRGSARACSRTEDVMGLQACTKALQALDSYMDGMIKIGTGAKINYPSFKP